MKRTKAIVAAGSLVGLLALASVAIASEPSFEEALETHLAAVTRHDMHALLPTLTKGQELTMITPEGKRLTTRDEYVDFHREWFAAEDPHERLEFEVERIIETPAMAHALMQIEYTFGVPGGGVQTYVGWLTLTFTLEDEKWRLVFDQNTNIQPAGAAQ